MIPDLPFARLGLFFDIDGTLIDIAERPLEVVVPTSLVAALGDVADRLEGAVALVSGRPIAEIDALFQPIRLRASGVHGAELRLNPDDATTTDSQSPLPSDVVAGVRAIVAAQAGTLMEDKRFSVAVHYRQAPEAAADLRRALDRLVQDSGPSDLTILPGHMVFEMKRATFNKGEAIRRFMRHAPFEGRVPVFLGDDVTDRPGFDAVLDMGGYAFSVGQTFSGLSGTFPSPGAVRHWLAGLAQSETSHA